MFVFVMTWYYLQGTQDKERIDFIERKLNFHTKNLTIFPRINFDLLIMLSICFVNTLLPKIFFTAKLGRLFVKIQLFNKIGTVTHRLFSKFSSFFFWKKFNIPYNFFNDALTRINSLISERKTATYDLT